MPVQRERLINFSPRVHPAQGGGRHPHASCARCARLDIGKINSKEELAELDGDDSALDGILNEFGVRFNLQKLHGVVFVRGDSPGGYFQYASCFFHGAALCQ
jgi:hypothetical protein